MIDDFSAKPETRWRFMTDGVMGGISSGALRFVREAGLTHARMTGQVSTARNGGFIQMRMDLATGLQDGVTGLRLIVRGNGQRYFVHLRSKAASAPWHYHQAGFDAHRNWAEVRLRLDSFVPSDRWRAETPRPRDLISVGIVAYGRDHQADIEVREVGFH